MQTATHTPEPCTPSREQLEIAYRELYRPVIWPATLDAALANYGFRTAITQVARGRNRVKPTATTVHTLPRLPAPPTPAGMASANHGRSSYSKASGPLTELTSWRGSSPKEMMQRPRVRPDQGLPFDPKRAAANDLDD